MRCILARKWRSAAIAILQFAFDSRSKNLHNAGQRSGRGIVLRPHRCVNPKKVGLSRFCEGARPPLGNGGG